MSKSQSHKKAQINAAGNKGKTEVKLRSGKILDALTSSGKRATEVERSGSPQALLKAAERLKESGSPQKVLQVPQKDIPKAVQAMKKIGITGTVKNMANTKRRSVLRIKPNK